MVVRGGLAGDVVLRWGLTEAHVLRGVTGHALGGNGGSAV